MFENRVLRKIFGPKRDEVTRELRGLHNEELYSLPKIWVIQVKKNGMGEEYSTWGGGRGAYKVLMGKPEGKRPLLRHGHSWKDNIKMDLQEVGWGGTWTVLIWLGMEPGGGIL
jgi:hypothetical protein